MPKHSPAAPSESVGTWSSEVGSPPRAGGARAALDVVRVCCVGGPPSPPQPMPETTSAWYGSMLRSARASLSELIIEKSPQPAHQVISDVASNSLGSSRVTTGHLLLQSGHDLLRREGPAVVLVQRPVHLYARRHPQQPCELRGVVLLHHDRAPAAAERRRSGLLRHRPEARETEHVGAAARGVYLVGGLLAGAVRGAPADERGLRLLRAIQGGRPHLLLRFLKLAHPLPHHAAAVLVLLRDVARFVVLVAGGGEHAQRVPGERPRRHARLRELEAPVAIAEAIQLLVGERPSSVYF